MKKIEKIYWTFADGSKIDIDDMSMYYLKNSLKFVTKHIIGSDKCNKCDAGKTKRNCFGFNDELNK